MADERIKVITELTRPNRVRKLARMMQEAADLAQQLQYHGMGKSLRDYEIILLRRLADNAEEKDPGPDA